MRAVFLCPFNPDNLTDQILMARIGRFAPGQNGGFLEEQLINDHRAREFVDRVRLFAYAWKQPVGRLAHDVEDVERFGALDSHALRKT